MVGPVDFQIAQQVREYRMSRVPFTRIRLAVQSLYPHQLHQSLDAFAANPKTIQPQQITQHATAGIGNLQMQFINPAHQFQITGRGRPRLVIGR